MNENEEQVAARFIRNSSVNVQVEFSIGWEGETLLCLRATPWRNSARPNRMILVASNTIGDALTLLATELDGQRWVPLDWRARPVEAGVYEPEFRGPQSLEERVRQLRTLAEKSRSGLYEPTDEGPEGA